MDYCKREQQERRRCRKHINTANSGDQRPQPRPKSKKATTQARFRHWASDYPPKSSHTGHKPRGHKRPEVQKEPPPRKLEHKRSPQATKEERTRPTTHAQRLRGEAKRETKDYDSRGPRESESRKISSTIKKTPRAQRKHRDQHHKMQQLTGHWEQEQDIQNVTPLRPEPNRPNIHNPTCTTAKVGR